MKDNRLCLLTRWCERPAARRATPTAARAPSLLSGRSAPQAAPRVQIKAGRPRSDDEPNEEFYAMFNSEEGTKAAAVVERCKQYMNTGSEVSDCHVVFRVHFFCRITAAPSTGNTGCWRIAVIN